MSDQQAGSPTAPAATAPAATASAATAGTAPPSPGPAATDGSGGDWTVQVADGIESVVATVRRKTTVPITKIARGVVFGLLTATLGVVALLLTVVGVIRVVDVYLPFDPYYRRVWITYAGLGAIFLLAGAFCWSKRTARNSQ